MGPGPLRPLRAVGPRGLAGPFVGAAQGGTAPLAPPGGYHLRRKASRGFRGIKAPVGGIYSTTP